VRSAAAGALAALALLGCAAPRPLARPVPSRPAPPDSGEGRPERSGAQRPLPIPLASSEYHEEPEVVGVTHVVRRGETVYRIARAYGVTAADLLEVNGIVDPRQVATGAELFVPGASRVVDQEETTGLPAPGPGPGGASRPSRTSLSPAPPEREGEAGGARSAVLGWPLQGVLYGRYGVRSGHRHDGIDLAAPEGTPIGAAAAGTVIFAGEQAGYGSILILRHADGLVTVYAHCSSLLVEEGRQVRRGELVARVGRTGRTTGPHLHFEVRQGTRPRNPLLFLP
jgi:murein DD-endopeptidase MepM/ murein hydrolase activator NlpD